MSFTTSKNIYRTLSVLGNGNCVFNAFALGFFDPKILTSLEKKFAEQQKDPNLIFSDFIKAVKKSGLTPDNADWNITKQILLQRKKNHPVQFQNEVGPLLRQISCDLSYQDKQHLLRTKEPLLSAFQDYLDHIRAKTTVKTMKDDIFIHHDFIYRAFNKIAKTFSIDDPSIENELKEQVWDWWQIEGYHQYLNNMADHEKKFWADDLQLYQLAHYFQVNLLVWVKDFCHQVHVYYGQFPRNLFSEEIIAQLVTRGVVDHPKLDDNFISFLKLDESELNLRLSAIPSQEIPQDFFLSQPHLKGRVVPNNWSQAMVNQLFLRNIICLDQSKKNYLFNVNSEEALYRISEISNKNLILKTWQTHFLHYPTITLENNAQHYNVRFNNENEVAPRWEQVPRQLISDEEVNRCLTNQTSSKPFPYIKYYFFDTKKEEWVTRDEQVALDRVYAEYLDKKLNPAK